MRYWAVIAFVGTAMVFASTNVRALSGLSLYQSCQAKSQSAWGFACIAYVHGFLDGSMFGLVIGRNAPTMYCPPKEGVSVDQGRLIIEKHLREHPEQLDKEAGELVADALMADRR